MRQSKERKNYDKEQGRGRVEGNHMTWNREDAGKDYLYRKGRGRSEEEKNT